MASQSDYEVAVVGAGPAGVAAAAAASAAGARVLLVESTHRLGGSVSAAMHRSLCGLYSHAPTSPIDTLNAGAQRDVVARMVQLDAAAVKPRQLGRAWVLEFPAPAWEAALADTCSQSNIDRRMNCRIVAVHREDSRITGVEIEQFDPPAAGAPISDPPVPRTKSFHEIGALIDCTGGGVALQMAGDDVAFPLDSTERMLGGFSIRLAGLSGDLELLRLQIPYTLAQAVSRGALPPEARFTMFSPGPGEGEGICKLAVNPDHFSADEVQRFARRVVEQLQNEIPGFAAARVVDMSPRALPRDGRRLRGKFVVTEQDVQGARRHGPDAVHAWWPIEHWDVKNGPTYAYPPDGQHYDIPGDALRSAVVTNLLAAGTCVSATATAAASLRASGICLATGHAAGRLAASILT